MKKNLAIIVSIAVLVIVIDQLSKWLAAKYLPYFLNREVAWNIPLQNEIMAWLAPILILFILWMLWKSLDLSQPLSRLALGLILGGAIGNYLDRILRGGVVDFIDFGFFPTFNLADSAITIGVLLILFVRPLYGRIK